MAKRKDIHRLCELGIHTFPDANGKCVRCRKKMPRGSMPSSPAELFGFGLLSAALGVFMDGMRAGHAAERPVEFDPGEFAGSYIPYDTLRRAVTWRRVLGFGDVSMPTIADIKKHYHERAKQCHPDKGGDSEQFKILTAARDAALKELG